MNDTRTRTTFFKKFIEAPKKIGSITPSSSFLTRKMLADLPWDQLETIVELGAGTGVFTEFIDRHRRKNCRVIIVEQDAELRRRLQQQFSDFCFGTKACELEGILRQFNTPTVDCIVSGLPFAAFSQQERLAILASIERSLKPNGHFLAFQYSLQLRGMLQQHFPAVSIDFVPLNLPPAFIYSCRK